jgi:hypothetical protein
MHFVTLLLLTLTVIGIASASDPAVEATPAAAEPSSGFPVVVALGGLVAVVVLVVAVEWIKKPPVVNVEKEIVVDTLELWPSSIRLNENYYVKENCRRDDDENLSEIRVL